MPTAPEFLLRKLYVSGSLASLMDGFSFILNDTLIPVTITGFNIWADGEIVTPECLSLRIEGSEEIKSTNISEQHPLQLELNVPLTIRAVTKKTKPQRLIIEANSREIGILRFSLDLREHRLKWLKPFKNLVQAGREWSKRRRVNCDPHHPIYHFTPPANWMNDPNGLVYWQGKHHLFYQYNPSQPVWGSIHWGHAESSDLVHWKRLPIALTPTPDGADKDGCWSGSAFVDENTLRFFYTGVFPEAVCMALPGMRLKKLEKFEGNPVIAGSPSEIKVSGFRDPVVWKESDGYYMTVGCGIEGKGGAVLLFRSNDLVQWEYLHPVLVGDSRQTKPVFTGSIWECPQLFALGAKHVLMVSVYHISKLMYSIVFIGEYRNHQFHPQSVQKIDQGEGSFYAPQSFTDYKGRRVLFGWVMEDRSESACQNAGWAGALSLPRILEINEKGKLSIEPAPELKLLHDGDEIQFSGTLSEPASPISGVLPIRNHEIFLTMKPGKNSTTGIRLAEDDQSENYAAIEYDQEQNMLMINTHYAFADDNHRSAKREIPVELNSKGDLELRIFIDGSIIEVYAHQTAVITTRFYPDFKKPLFLFGYSKYQPSSYDMNIWKMGSCF
jgi:beta-fructofuranosidase